MSLRAGLAAAFAQAFGGAPTLVARAPGRVNLIGEHTDYNGGFVLPAAISVETLVALRVREGREVRAFACDFGEHDNFPLARPILPRPGAGWSSYVRGMVAAMQALAEGAGIELPGFDLAIAGSIPRGAGLSSSASLTVAIGTGLAALAGLATDATAIALAAQACEHDFAGVQCGIMDQLASARGRAGHALRIDCRSLACEAVPMPAGAAILIVHSGVERGLVDGHYNARRRACAAAAAALGVSALRDADLAALAAARLDAEATARARHVITENARVLAAAEALAAGELVALGELMRASHASMAEDFAITLPPIDALAGELNALIAAHAGGHGGARMTGGGFGGAVVAVLPEDAVAAVCAVLTYRTPAGAAPLIMVERACDGAGFL